MIEPISIYTVLGLSLYAMIMVMRWWTKINDQKQKRLNEIDKQIDDANNASDIMRVSGELHNQ